MLRARLILFTGIALAALLALWLILRDAPEPSGPPPAPPTGAPEPDDRRPGLSTPPPFFSESRNTPTSTPEGRDPVAPGGSVNEEELGMIRDAAGAALRRLAPLMHELDSIKLFVDGVPGGEWTLTEVPGEILGKLIARLDSVDARTRMEVVLALSLVKLSGADQAMLEQRLEAEIASMRSAAEKNVVLALAFTLHAQGNPRGLRRLEDSIARREREDVEDYRNGATYLLALAADPESAPALRTLLADDPDRLVRKHAALGLGKIGGDENRDALGGAVFAESDVEVRAWAALAAGRASPPGEGADPRLLRALTEDTSGEVRGASAYALSRAQGADSVPTLENLFYSDDHPVARVGAVAGVAAHGDVPGSGAFIENEGSPFLVATARASENRQARFYSTVVLGQLPASEERTAALEKVAAADESGWVRGGAVESLVRTRGREALPFLRERLPVEDSPQLQLRIRDLIRQFEPETEESEPK